eukprot:Skav210222  [mRNA]  locus=scaffold2492:243640:246204:+ [translate_table: standard]
MPPLPPLPASSFQVDGLAKALSDDQVSSRAPGFRHGTRPATSRLSERKLSSKASVAAGSARAELPDDAAPPICTRPTIS